MNLQFLNQQQLQMLLTSIVVSGVDSNYVPQVIQTQAISNNPIIQQLAPYLANAIIQRLQSTASSSPSHFSYASFNILGQNGFNNNEFKSVTKILATVLEIQMAMNPQIAQNPVAYVGNHVAEWLSGALAMMYQKFTNIAGVFPMDVQQKIGSESARIGQVLNAVMGGNMAMMGGMNSMGGVGNMGGLLGQQTMQNNMQAFGQIPSLSVPDNNRSTERLFANNQQAAQQPHQPLTVENQKEDYYTAKLRLLQNGQLGDNNTSHRRERSYSTPPQESESVLTPTPNKPPAPITMLSGGPDGLVIQTTNRELDLNKPVLAENAYEFRTSEIREDNQEPVWDAVEENDTFVQSMDQALIPTTQDILTDTFFEQEDPDYPGVEMSGWPGIDKKGNLIFKKEVKEAFGQPGFLEMLNRYPSYSFAEVEKMGLAWYPSIQFPVPPEHDSQTQVLRYWAVLHGEGLLAVAVEQDKSKENHMNYEQHGIGYVPKFISGVKVEKEKEKITDGKPPKAFRLKTRQHTEVYVDTCFESSYRAKNVSFAPNPSDESDHVENVHLANQQALVAFQPFGFSSKELKEAAVEKINKIDKALTLKEAAEILETLEDHEEIPLRTALSNLFTKQIIRCVQLRGGINLEFDEFDVATWEVIHQHIQAGMPESFVEEMKKAELLIISEVMGGIRNFNVEDMLEQMDAIIFDEIVPPNAHVFYMMQYEQAVFVPQLASQLEIGDNRKSFLIPERSTKLYAMANDILNQTGAWPAGIPSSCVIITRDGYRIEVATSLLNRSSVMGSITKI